VRKSLYGRLGEIQHANPSLGSGWAESFYRNSGGSERVTLAEIERRIASAEIDLAGLRKQRDDLVAQEERDAQAQADAELAEKRARIEAARAAMAELAAEIEELEGDLEPEPEPDQTRRR
jgi:chromosome segregation ATPase